MKMTDAIAALDHQGERFFTVDDLVGLGLDRPQARSLAYRMAETGRAKRIKRNFYALLEPRSWGTEAPVFDWYEAADRLAGDEPHYLAYYTAMELHRMLRHPLMTVTVGVRRQTRDVRVPPLTIRFVTVREERMFGTEVRKERPALGLHVTDLERTMVDAVDRMDLCGGLEEVVRGLSRRHDDLDPRRLVEYLQRFDSPVVTKRLGFLLEAVGHDDPALLWQLQDLAGKIRRYTPLANDRPTDGARRDSRWELLINERVDRLMGARDA